MKIMWMCFLSQDILLYYPPPSYCDDIMLPEISGCNYDIALAMHTKILTEIAESKTVDQEEFPNFWAKPRVF